MKKFSGMTRAEKRVALAKDVLAQLKAKRMIPQQGSYCDTVKPGKLIDPKITCQVCAVG